MDEIYWNAPGHVAPLFRILQEEPVICPEIRREYRRSDSAQKRLLPRGLSFLPTGEKAFFLYDCFLRDQKSVRKGSERGNRFVDGHRS